MPEFTSILRQRLGAEEGPKTHPDADTLTAYVEELLPASERSQILLHISLCKQCRDVISLTMPERAIAAPEQEPEVAVAAIAARRKALWFLTPKFGMAASLAAVALGVVLVLKIPQRDQKAPVPTASVQQPKEAPALPAQPAEGSVNGFVNPAASAPARSSGAAEQAHSAENRAPLLALAAPARKAAVGSQSQPPLTIAGNLQSDYVNNQLFVADAVATAQVQELPSAPRPARPTFALNQPATLSASTIQAGTLLELTPPSGSDVSQGNGVIYQLSGAERQGISIASRITQLHKQLRMKRPGPAISVESASSYAMFSHGLSRSEPAELTAQPQNMPAAPALAQSPAFTGRAMRGSLSALDHGATFLWKVTQGRLLKSSDMEHWAEAYPAAEGIEFSAVTANGPEVWAGGRDAALVHSSDGGATWERVTLGASATGNINSILVSGPAIQIRNSSGQGWVSQDSGRSWSLQN